MLSIFNSNVSAAPLTSNLEQISRINDEQFHLIFEDVGEMASSATYVFSKMTIDIAELEETIKLEKAEIRNIIYTTRALPNNTNNMDILKSKLEDNLIIHLVDLSNELRRLKSIRSKLPKPVEHQKVDGNEKLEKRSILQILFGTLGTFMGIFSQKQYDKLEQRLTTTNEIQKRLVEVVNNQGKEMTHIKDSLIQFQDNVNAQLLLNPANLDAALQSNTRKIKAQVDRIFQALQAAQYRRLSIEFLDENETEQLYKLLSKTAESTNSALLITQPSDLVQLEVSYFFNGQTITLLLHVPIIQKGSLLKLVKLHPFPLPIAGNYSIVPDVESQLLALSNDGSRLSVQFPATNLMSCHQTNHVYLCENQGVLDKQLTQSCLGALYSQDIKTSLTLCPMKIIYAEEVVYKLKDNINLVYTPIQQTVPIRCPNRTYDKWLQIGVTEFQLDAGCMADFKHHVLLANNAITLEGDVTHISMPRTSNMGIPNVSKQQIEEELDNMKRAGLYRPTVNDLIEAHTDNDIIKSLRSELAKMKSIEDKIIKDFTFNINELQRTITESKQQSESNKSNLKNLTIELDDIHLTGTTSTPLFYSIINWSLCIILFIFIFIFLIYLYSQFKFQINTFLEAFQVKTLQQTRPVLIKFFEATKQLTQTPSDTPIQTSQNTPI